MVRKLLKRKIWVICFVAMIIVGLAYLASVSSRKTKVENEWRYWTSKYQSDKQRYESLVQSNSSQEGKNTEKEEQIRGIWQVVSNWGTVSYEEAVEVGASGEFAKYALAEKLDDLALDLVSTSSDKVKIQKCQEFIKDVTETIGKEGLGHQAIEYANYLIRVFKDRK